MRYQRFYKRSRKSYCFHKHGIKIKKSPFFIIPLFIALLLPSCDWFTSPEELEPGRRDYVWTADTLDLVMNDFRSIWGSSPEDVWVGTFQYGENFYYNGETWTKHEEIRSTGYALYGFSNNDVWIGGDDGRIWHYDGTSWVENFRYADSKFKSATIRDFAGDNSNNLYVVGITFCEGNFNEWTQNQRAFILYYDGYQWEEKFFADFQSQFTKIKLVEDNYYIFNVTVDNMHGDTNVVYQYYVNDNECRRLFSDTGILNINNIDNRLLVVMDNKIYWYNGNELVDMRFPQVSDVIHQIYGRHVNDILIRIRNSIIHYNGTDIKNLYSFDNEWTYSTGGAIIFEKEVFFCCSDYINNNFFILKGKLN